MNIPFKNPNFSSINDNNNTKKLLQNKKDSGSAGLNTKAAANFLFSLTKCRQLKLSF